MLERLSRDKHPNQINLVMGDEEKKSFTMLTLAGGPHHPKPRFSEVEDRETVQGPGK
jgi:hypothetical protein